MRKILLALMLCAGAGCASTAHSLTIVIREIRTEKVRVTIAGEDVEADDVRVILNALTCMPDEVLRGDNIRFEITADRKRLPKTWNGYESIGVYREYPSRQILLLPRLQCETVWHEMAHFHESSLKYRKELFATEWQTVAGDVYTNNASGATAGSGVVRAYGRGNYKEDIATWVELVYSLTRSQYNQFSRIGDFKTDPRYKKKLDLLLKYHFINQSDYDLTCELFK